MSDQINAADAAPATDIAAAAEAAQDPALQNLPLRAYLDKTVVPILLQALSECAKERPAHPIEYVANYLLENNPEKRNWNSKWPESPHTVSILKKWKCTYNFNIERAESKSRLKTEK